MIEDLNKKGGYDVKEFRTLSGGFKTGPAEKNVLIKIEKILKLRPSMERRRCWSNQCYFKTVSINMTHGISVVFPFRVCKLHLYNYNPRHKTI